MGTPNSAGFKFSKQQTTAQPDAQNLSKTEHRTADELLADIVAARLDIQLAADQEWPWTTREHDIIRAQFKLPLTRPMKE